MADQERFDVTLEGIVRRVKGEPFSSIKFEWNDMGYESMLQLEKLLGQFYQGLIELGEAKVTKQ